MSDHPNSSGERLLVVSNRLPFTLKKTEQGEWQAQPSSGGLATAMDPILRRTGGIWIGWSGEDEPAEPEARDAFLSEAAQGFRCAPVDLHGELAAAFYEGFPNRCIWPVFHYFPDRMSFGPEAWDSYVEGNRRFCEAVAAEYSPGDLIWVHDYHLMLLPSMLRERLPEARIGFFLHIPFPSSEVFAILPRGEELLQGLLGADLIAFHTHRYVHHFRSALLRVLGLESKIDVLEHAPRAVHFEAMPIGIAPEELTHLVTHDQETENHYSDLRRRYENQRVVIAVDRMDYTKGIPQRLRAFRRLLQNHTSLRGNITLIQVAVPSRENIESYQDLRNEVNQLVGEINGKLATSDWSPVVYINQGISREELAALYKLADVAWVTPLRDGMNLVAKEYCACKPDGGGALLLSEFAGSAAEMGEAFQVNPYDEETAAETLARILAMDPAEKSARMRALHERIRRKSVFDWADTFVTRLREIETTARPPASSLWGAADRLISHYARSRSRALMLDYDGTLAPFTARPEDAAPPSRLLETLSALCADPANSVALVSGRRAAQLEHWFGNIGRLILGAEHGAILRPSRRDHWLQLRGLTAPPEWKEKVRPILEHFVDRTPGSFVEEKEFSLVWHYRRAEPEFGEWLAGELVDVLGGMLSDTEALPVRGNKIVEVRPVWANKGNFVGWMRAARPDATFLLAAGDDRTDEDMFAQMPDESWTIHVGGGVTRAAFSVATPGEMSNFLAGLAGAGSVRVSGA